MQKKKKEMPSKQTKQIKRKKKRIKFQWDYGIFGVLFGVAMLCHPFIVSGSSMQPSFHDKDAVFTMKSPVKPNRFDVVIVSNDNTKQISGKNSYWIKRVIALPGETVSYSNNKLYINGKAVKQSFKTETPTSDFGPVKLADDEYWLMGDNRNNSCDSRYVGAFTRSDIKSVYCFSISKKGE